MSGKVKIVHYAEALGHGRAVERCDILLDGELVSSMVVGSPAPLGTVQRACAAYNGKVAVS